MGAFEVCCAPSGATNKASAAKVIDAKPNFQRIGFFASAIEWSSNQCSAADRWTITSFVVFGSVAIRESLAQGSNYWLGRGLEGSEAAEDAAAWEITINLNDDPFALNFIVFLSSANSIGVFSGMMCCSSGFGWRIV